MNETEFFPWSLDIFDKIEDSDEFKNIDPEISKIFYHVFIKIKRNYQAIHHLFNGAWENSYIESIPLIRILAEAYFHFCNIIDENDNKLLVKEYKALEELQAYKVAKNLNDFDTNLLPEEEKFIEMEFSGKDKPKAPKHLQYISELVKKISNKNNEIDYIYTRIYNGFSSYVHFNPATSVLYGTQTKDKFIFNQIIENGPLVDSLKSHTNGIIILFFTKVIDYLQIEFLKDEFFNYYDEDKKIFNFKY